MRLINHIIINSKINYLIFSVKIKMYNIDLYTYEKKPFIRGKKFKIHPLDNPGKEKYFSQESHCTHYLKRTDPFVFKSILGIDYDTLVKLQKNDIETFKSIQSSKDSKILPKSIDKNIEKGEHTSKNITTEENKKNLAEKDDQYNDRYNTYGNEEDIRNTRKFRTYHSSKSYRPYHRERNFKDIYGYENVSTLKSKQDKYLNLINNIKYSHLENGTNRYRRKYDGYTSYEIPLINLNKKNSDEIELNGNKLGYSLNSFKKTVGGKKSMNEEELKQNLFNQTSRQFLKRYHLPNVLKIASSTQLIRKQKIGLSKEMGERYNPYSLIAPSKNRIGRNYVGDLFKH